MLDGVFADPRAIVEAVARHARFSDESVAASGYPGVQALAPTAYAHALIGAAGPFLSELYGRDDGTIGEIGCMFSLVTRSAEALHPLQTVPHVDIADPARFAILHFLCDPPFGGTAFYRQEATGLEQLSRTDWPAFAAARDASPGCGYPSEATPGYVQTAAIPARMDRLLVYRSHTLHSGIVRPGVAHPADPRRGRLTGNLFARYRTA